MTGAVIVIATGIVVLIVIAVTGTETIVVEVQQGRCDLLMPFLMRVPDLGGRDRSRERERGRDRDRDGGGHRGRDNSAERRRQIAEWNMEREKAAAHVQ